MDIILSDLPGFDWISGTDFPFICAVAKTKSYKSSHGTVKVIQQETFRAPLTDISTEDDELIFSGGGVTLRMKLTQCDGGVEAQLRCDEGYGIEFRFPAIYGEAVFGGGEQYRKVNLRHEKVVNFVSEHIKASTIVEKALLPRKLYREKKHHQIGSYAPMPVFVTDKGRLFLFNTSSDGFSQFDDGCYLFSFDSCPESFLYITGNDYQSLSLELAKRLGNRQYIPDWCYDGMILSIQGGSETILSKTFEMLDAGAKICGIWSQDWSGENITPMGKQVWWNWEADEKLYPDLKGAIKKLNDRGVRFLAYINPYLVKDSELYKYCADKGFLIKGRDGEICHIRSTTFDAGMLDLTDPQAVRFIKDVLIKKNMLELGVSGWMADFGEYLPVDCLLHDGDAAKLHNQWPVLWAKINREAIEEYGRDDVMFFTRSGYLGIQNYTPIMWNGDQHTDYSRDYGMPCVMPASFSLGFSGVSMVHSDIGGFFSFGKLKRDGELFTRWMEMCCFSPLMRSHESIRPWANAQFDAEDVKAHTVALTCLHAELKPYIQHCISDAAKGIPAMRPDFWYEMDYSFSRDEYSYFLGDDLFVCPVVEPGAKQRKVCLPKGDWVNFWTGEKLSGNVCVNAPLGQIPVFYRSGSSYTELFCSCADKYMKG